jgi:hypothetical protein
MSKAIYVEYNDDLTIRPKTKADEKRIRQALKSFKGKEVAVLVQEDSTIRFLDLAMPNDPILSSALYGGLGAIVGSLPGAIIASPVAMWLGWTAGGALGARAGAPDNRKSRATWGGGLGGSLGGPVGAALGGALGSRKTDKNRSGLYKELKNDQDVRQLKNKLLK